MTQVKSVVLARRPKGNPVAEDFQVEVSDLPTLRDGELLCRNHFVSLDAGFRNWMNEGSGDAVLPAMELGAPVCGLVLGEVIDSHNPLYAQGDMLMARFAWQTHSISDGSDFIARLPATLEFDPAAYMGVLGDTGMSAYFGMTDILKPSSNDCVLISGAGGAVGSIAGQLAKKSGARVVGLVGSEEKGQWICDVLGYDAAVVRGDADNMAEAIRKVCPEGVDAFFDNVGGEALEAAISNMNHRGRMALCGAVSGYGVPAYGPSNLFEIVTKEIRAEGFMTHFRHDRYEEAREALSEGLRSGALASPEYRLQGIHQIGQAYADLFAGRNFGKTIVEL